MRLHDPINFFVYRKDDSAYVRLAGSLTTQNFESALNQFEQVITPSSIALYVMIRELRYVDSAGLGLFVKLSTRCRSSKLKFQLLEPTPEVNRLFNLSRLDRIIPIERGLEANALRGEFENIEFAVDPGE